MLKSSQLGDTLRSSLSFIFTQPPIITFLPVRRVQRCLDVLQRLVVVLVHVVGVGGHGAQGGGAVVHRLKEVRGFLQLKSTEREKTSKCLHCSERERH